MGERHLVQLAQWRNPACKSSADQIAKALTGTYRLTAGLLYGSGSHLMEYVRLRVKDVDFARNQIVVRDGKG
jgi:site-specific recombinase XerD